MVHSVIRAAAQSRPENHRICISRQTSSGGGSNTARTPDCVAQYQAPKTLANRANWITRMRTRSPRIMQHPKTAHCEHRINDELVHARDPQRLPGTRSAPSPLAGLAGEGWGAG